MKQMEINIEKSAKGDTMSDKIDTGLKKSVVFKNQLPVIEKKISEGMTLKSIANEMGFKYETFKKYYMRFKNTSPVSSEKISHAKIIQEQEHNEADVLPVSENKELFNDLMDADKRSESLSEYMTQKKPLGKGRNK